MVTRRVSKAARKGQSLLVSMAESIGSTLGTVAGKADVFSKPAPRRKATVKSQTKAKTTRKKRKA